MSRSSALLLAWLAGVAAVLFAAGGAAASALGAFEDEPAHVATALMIRDWLASLSYGDPLGYAEAYYARYPKVAIGQWPPVFHGALALWMAAAGIGTLAIASFNWLLAVLAAAIVARTVARELGAVSGALSGALFLALPLVQELAGAAMTEIPVALLGTLAALAFGRWIDAPSARRSGAFALLAALAILTKGSALALALVPPIALVVARRTRDLGRPSLWLSAAIVAVLALPWYALSLPIARTTWSEGSSPSLAFLAEAAREYPRELLALGGAAFLALALAGIAERVRAIGRGEAEASRGRWAALVAWLASLGILHLTIPSSIEARHLVAAAPALTIFAALGASAVLRAAFALARRRAGAGDPWRRLAVPCLAAAFLATRFTVVEKRWSGFDEAARVVLDDPELGGDTVLVASGALGEGLLVLGFALGESPRLERQVLRASKVMASASWIGEGYVTRHASPAEAREWLASIPIAAVLLDGSTPARHARRHLDILRGALEAAAADGSGEWRRARRVDVVRGGELHAGALEVWVSRAHAARRPRTLALPEVLGRDLPRF